MAPLNLTTLCFLCVIANIIAVPVTPSKHTPSSNAQFVHEKEDTKTDPTNNDDNDEYPLTNDYKPDPPQPQYSAWNPFMTSESSAAARFLGLFGYPSPLIIPYPVFLPQDSMYPYQDYDDYEDAMARAGSRRGSGYRNSPVYYIRLPPTPYMFIPGLGYHSQPPTFTPSFSPLLPYNQIQALPVQPSINPFINLPLNFISNGKPTGIYQLESNPLPSQYQPSQYQPSQYQPSQYQPPQYQPSQYQPFAPPPPPSTPTRPYRPSYAPPSQSFIPSDTKISQLKRPYLFNGRPEQIYVLPSSFNPMYQSPIPGYY